jgi:hypothetical protein
MMELEAGRSRTNRQAATRVPTAVDDARSWQLHALLSSNV